MKVIGQVGGAALLLYICSPCDTMISKWNAGLMNRLAWVAQVEQSSLDFPRFFGSRFAFSSGITVVESRPRPLFAM
jgi:hypothetical protein